MKLTALRKWKLAFAATTMFTCFLPWPAQAGPLAGLVPIITSIAGGASATAVLGQLALSALVVGANMIIQKLLMPKQKVVGIKDKLQTGGDLPLSILMGNAMTAGKLIYVNQGGNSLNNMLTLVIGISQIPVNSYSTKVWINNEICDVNLAGTIPEADAPGGSYGFYPITQYDKLSASKYHHQYCWMKFYDGTQTTPDQYLRDTFGSDPDKPWLADMIGRGQAYVIVVCRYSALGIWSGVPSFKFEVKGAKLYDISKDSTNGGSGSQRWNTPSTWAFSDNPKVMAYNIIRGISYNGAWVYGGQGVSGYQLPSDYWVPAIAHCAANVTTADARTISRYTACCEIDVDQQPLDIIKELDKCCAGYTMEYGGTWKTYAGPPGSSVLTITDENVIISEDQTDDLYRPAQDTFNGARATFLSQKAGWVMKDIKPYIDATYQTEDGGLQLIADMEFPMVTEITQARRLMRLAVRDSRKQRTHVIQLPPAAMLLEPWSVINWNSDRNGYVNKKFTVQSIDDLPNCNQALLIREVDTTDYDYDNTYDTIEPVGILRPVRPGALALDFTVSPDQVDKVGTAGAKDKPAIKIDWTWGLDDVDLKWIKWEVRISATQTKVIASGTFYNMSDNTKTITSAAFRFKRSYQIRLFAQPERTWRDSDWTAWKNVTLYDIDIPAQPTLTRVIQQADDGTQVFYLDMTCTAIAAEGTYVWRVISDGVTRRYKSDENEQRIPVTSGKTYLVDVRFIADDGGTRGDYSPTNTITITKKANNMPAVSGLVATGNNKGNRVDWTDIDDDTYPDYRNTAVWRNTVNTTPIPGTTASYKRTKSGYLDDKNTGTTPYYYWVAHRDNSGNFGALAGPVSAAGTLTGTVDLAAGSVTDAITDQAAPGTPSAPALTTFTADVDGDGTVDTGLSVALTIPSGVPVKFYEVELQRSSTLGGTYAAFGERKTVKAELSGTTNYAFKANSAKFYKARYRAIAFGGKEGSYSPLTATGVQPLQYLSTIPTPALTVTPKAKGMRIRWPKWADNTYLETIVLRDGVEIDRVKASTYLDQDELTIGQGYTYTAQHVDKQMRTGAASTGVAGVYRGVKSTDSNINDPSSMAENSDLSLGPNVGWVVASAIVNDPTNAFRGNYVSIYSGTSSFAQRNTLLFPVRAGERYYIGGMIKTSAGWAGAYVGYRLSFTSDAAGASEITSVAQPFVTAANTTWAEYGGHITVPSTATIGFARLEMVVISQTAGTAYWSHCYCRPAAGKLVEAGGIAEAQTDQTAPATPTVTLNTFTGDIDGDGTADVGLSVAITNLNVGVAIKRYIIEISRSDTSGGTYAVWRRETVEAEDYADNPVTTYIFKANKNKFHKVRVRAVAFGGKKGAFSGLTSAVQPTTYSGYTGITGSAPTVAPVANGLKIDWALTDSSAVALNTSIYKETEILVGGVSLIRVSGLAYTDTTIRTAGSSYTITLKHYDKNGGVTTVSAGTAATYRAAQSGEIGTGQVLVGNTDQAALAAPSCLNSASATVASAVYLVQDAIDIDGDGKTDTTIVSQWNTLSGAVRYDVEVSRWDAGTSTWKVTGLGGSAPAGVESFAFKANTSRLYKVRVRGRNFAGAPGAWTTNVVVLTTSTAFSSYTGFQPAGKTTAPNPPTNLVSSVTSRMGQSYIVAINGHGLEADYSYTNIYLGTVNDKNDISTSRIAAIATGDIINSWRAYIAGISLRPGTTYYVWAENVNNSGVVSSSYPVSSTAGYSFVAGYVELADTASGLFNDGVAAMSSGAKGTYGMFRNSTASLIGPGSTTAGSNLTYSDNVGAASGASPSGTWTSEARVTAGGVGLFRRTA